MLDQSTLAGILTAVGVSLGIINLGCAQDLPGDIQSGKRLAQAWCSNCHRIDANAGVVDGAPDFYSVANLPSTTALSLKVFFQTNHRDMPNFHIGPSEADDLIAYILSLKKR